LRSFDRAMPEEVNRVVADHLSRWLFVPTPAGVANLAAEGITAGVSLVGDLMQDLAARVSAEVRDPAALAALDGSGRGLGGASGGGGPALGLGLTPGGYLFATVHRAENRAPGTLVAWTTLLAALAAPDRPVVLALHPGTAAALDAAGIRLADDVHVIEPQGYRTTLTLQLHAAAILTDSGGVQREAAWLGVPCLILRDRTEWVEAVADSGGRMVVVGLDRAVAAATLDRLVPRGAGPRQAADRAERLDLRAAGAGEAIVAALESA
jgi:UDP-GlcNAc3NAcA epimerase